MLYFFKNFRPLNCLEEIFLTSLIVGLIYNLTLRILKIIEIGEEWII
jgi:hypothetical protein